MFENIKNVNTEYYTFWKFVNNNVIYCGEFSNIKCNGIHISSEIFTVFNDVIYISHDIYSLIPDLCSVFNKEPFKILTSKKDIFVHKLRCDDTFNDEFKKTKNFLDHIKYSISPCDIYDFCNDIHYGMNKSGKLLMVSLLYKHYGFL